MCPMKRPCNMRRYFADTMMYAAGASQTCKLLQILSANLSVCETVSTARGPQRPFGGTNQGMAGNGT